MCLSVKTDVIIIVVIFWLHLCIYKGLHETTVGYYMIILVYQDELKSAFPQSNCHQMFTMPRDKHNFYTGRIETTSIDVDNCTLCSSNHLIDNQLFSMLANEISSFSRGPSDKICILRNQQSCYRSCIYACSQINYKLHSRY